MRNLSYNFVAVTTIPKSQGYSDFLAKQVGRSIFDVRTRYPGTLPPLPEGFEVYQARAGWYRIKYDFFGPQHPGIPILWEENGTLTWLWLENQGVDFIRNNQQCVCCSSRVAVGYITASGHAVCFECGSRLGFDKREVA